MGICMTPDDFYRTFVFGNYLDFQAHQNCVKRAFNAAVSASHLADHYLAFHKRNDPSKVIPYNKKIGEFVEYISIKTNGYFRDIRSISNAYKHLYTSSNPNNTKYSSISSAGVIEVLTIEGENICELSSHYNSAAVIFTRKTGERIVFMIALERVVEFWGDFIFS